MQQDHLLAGSRQWSTQVLDHATSTEEFIQTGTAHLEHINSSMDTFLNQQLIEDKPTGTYFKLFTYYILYTMYGLFDGDFKYLTHH